MLSGIMFTYNGIGITIMGWVNTYLSGELAATVFTVIGIDIVQRGNHCGQDVLGNISERIGYPAALLICSVGGFIFVTSATVVQNLWWIGASLALTGVFLAGIFPISVACGTSLFPEMIGTVSGYVITAASLGSMLLPFLVGAFSDVVGLRYGMLAAPFLGLSSWLWLCPCIGGSSGQRP